MSLHLVPIKRRRVLALLGGAGALTLLPIDAVADTSACSPSTPEVTQGPYWVDEKLLRSDVRTDPTTGETRQGVMLALAITVVNSNSGNCVPLAGAWVDIWHCDATGIYSDESTYNPGGGTGNVNTQGEKFLRGYQVTDSKGVVNFTTIYPGWYSGRTIHIHVRIRTWSDAGDTTTLSNYTTQLFFDETVTNAVMAESPYNTRTSSRDTTNATDSVYNQAGSNKTAMLLTLAAGETGYTGAITVDTDLLTPTITSASPTISDGGVVSAASAVAGASPGAWISIYGSNLASTTYSATQSDLVNDYLPTKLQGVSVQIDGQPAYMDYVSPTQLNVLAPADSKAGTVSVSVANSGGMSNSVSVTQSTFLPGLFALSGYALAVRYSDSAIINGTGITAKPGDILELYATGLGPTINGTAPGLVFSGADENLYPATVTIGGQNATVLWTGLIAAGLWQINIVLPSNLADGKYDVVVTVNGASSPAGVSVRVAS